MTSTSGTTAQRSESSQKRTDLFIPDALPSAKAANACVKTEGISDEIATLPARLSTVDAHIDQASLIADVRDQSSFRLNVRLTAGSAGGTACIECCKHEQRFDSTHSLMKLFSVLIARLQASRLRSQALDS